MKKKIMFVTMALCFTMNLTACGSNQDSSYSSDMQDSNDTVDETAEIGDTVIFGSYEQDGDKSSTEGIEWIVMDKQGGDLLLLSKYVLDAKPYNYEDINVTWESSALRTWLNKSFYNDAFSEGEQSQIVATEIESEIDADNSSFTDDNVFLFSIDDANTYYFTSDSERVCTATEYAKNQGACCTDNGNCSWWLSSAGSLGGNFVECIDFDGCADTTGEKVGNVDIGVRPAIWVSTGNEDDSSEGTDDDYAEDDYADDDYADDEYADDDYADDEYTDDDYDYDDEDSYVEDDYSEDSDYYEDTDITTAIVGVWENVSYQEIAEEHKEILANLERGQYAVSSIGNVDTTLAFRFYEDGSYQYVDGYGKLEDVSGYYFLHDGEEIGMYGGEHTVSIDDDGCLHIGSAVFTRTDNSIDYYEY